MKSDLRDPVRLRGVALWCLTTAGAAAIASVAVPELAGARHREFDDLLVGCCSAAALVAIGWLWLITTDVVLRVLWTGGRVAVRHPGRTRLLVLVACGAVALTAPAAPSHADDRWPVEPPSLAGLPLPDRATGAGATRPAAQPSGPMVRVRPGDSLWTIAERRLGSRATPAAIAGLCHRIHHRNRDVIGADPDLIVPGQHLLLPPGS